jgi:D-tyrosyl-tRNA(Tyr) deacylase
MAKKICNYRVFSDEAGKMNLNVQQVNGEILLVSQFTLVAETDRGNRPSFSKGATPEHGEAMYELMKQELLALEVSLATGRFGADMQVSLLNDGPVTFNLNIK